ncbi:hypothetical protein TD95_005172 [Thielaviopsis punctulata]|uniref:Cyclin-dependent kinase n=1 Tax=Thielaviopsis punctulata TaxID=72032 RepID=A0A0F4ZHG7_9PEZI|nr:hypothetical protein TD95_005172 [Thielaviopsis punctulata]
MAMSLRKSDADSVADKVLKRAEVSKIARRLRDRLALAQFKTKHGWEDLTLDKIEPKVEAERRMRRRLAASAESDHTSDTSSTASDFPYPRPINGLMSSPLKAPAPLFSDSVLPLSTGRSDISCRTHRKRSYMVPFDDESFAGPNPARTLFPPSKRFRPDSPDATISFTNSHASWKDLHQLAQSSPIKPRKSYHAQGHTQAAQKSTSRQKQRQGQGQHVHEQQQHQQHQQQHQQQQAVLKSPMQRHQPAPHIKKQQHFTTTTGPNEPLFSVTALDDTLTSPPFHLVSDDEDDMPIHSFNHHDSPPRTPPMRSRILARPRNLETSTDIVKDGAEGAGLLMYLATSPTVKHLASVTPMGLSMGSANTLGRMEPPRTPPPKNSMLPSSMMTTPGGSNLFSTPGQTFDFADYVNITPSPAQKTWTRTPGMIAGGTRTPLSAKRLEFPSEFR